MKNSRKYIKNFLCVVVILALSKIEAQQPPQYTQYMYNTTILNPAYAGTNGGLEANILHRSQWVGIDGSPETQSFTIQNKVGEKVALGLTAFNDRIGAANNVKVNGNFAYEIPTGYNTKLSLGVNAGIEILNIDWSKGSFPDEQDPIFMQNLNETRPIFGAGAFFYSNNWYLGISSNNILNSKIYSDNDQTVTDRKSQYYFIAGYVIDLSGAIKFKPALLTKHVSGAPITLDISANFLFKKKVVFGVSYRYDDAVSALAGLHIAKRFFIGYSYDYTVAGLQNYNDGSHEIILRYNVLRQGKRALSPRFF